MSSGVHLARCRGLETDIRSFSLTAGPPPSVPATIVIGS